MVRWLVLVSLFFSLFRAFTGLRRRRVFSKTDNAVRHWTATIAHIQLMLGIWLYCISPIVAYFFTDIKTAIHERYPRFFGMEHSFMMITAVVLITIGSMKAKRQKGDDQKFRTILVWYGIALLVILSSIPWSFSPLISRPLWRGF